MRRFCVLRALLKSTILRKKLFLQSTVLKKKNFLKSMILNEKVFVKSGILKKIFLVLSDFELQFFTTRQILNQIFKHATDFGLNISKRVRF